MSNEIQRRVDQGAKAAQRAEERLDFKDLKKEPEKISLKDKEIFKRLVGFTDTAPEDESSAPSVGLSDAERAGVERDAAVFRMKTGERPEGGREDDAEPEEKERETAAGAAAGSMFDLVGRLSGEMLAASKAPERAAGEPRAPDLSRHELVNKVSEAAEALSTRVDEARGVAELRVEFKPEVLPDTAMRLEHNAGDGTLLVEFTTGNPKVNAFLLNSLAALREDLASRFGAEVAVSVRHDGGGAADSESDPRGRAPDWSALEGDK